MTAQDSSPKNDSTEEEELSAEDVEKQEVADLSAKLVARIFKGQSVVNACEKQILTNLVIRNKTLLEWGKELRVEMPDDSSDIQALEKASLDVAKSVQKVEYILGLFEVYSKASEGLFDNSFATQYVMEMEENPRVRVAAEKLRQRTLLNNEVDATLAATQAAKLVVSFFKRQLGGLEEVRKCLENQTRLIGHRMRLSM